MGSQLQVAFVTVTIVVGYRRCDEIKQEMSTCSERHGQIQIRNGCGSGNTGHGRRSGTNVAAESAKWLN